MIRLANSDDIYSINNIYNQAVDSRKATADLEHTSIDSRRTWFMEHNETTHPIYVYETEGKAVAWISVSPYRKGRRGLAKVVEVSYYVDSDYYRKGIASELMHYVINKSSELCFQHIVCILLEINKASIAFLEKFGFEKWGDLPNIVDLDGVQCNHYFYGKTLKND